MNNVEIGGFTRRVQAIDRIRNHQGWSHYVVEMLGHNQQSVRIYIDRTKLRFLLYPSYLRPCDQKLIKNNNAGVIWLLKHYD